MGGGASRAREREREPAPPHTPRGGDEPASRPAALPVAQMESVSDLVVVTRGLQQELVDKAAQLRRELHFVTKDKVRLHCHCNCTGLSPNTACYRRRSPCCALAPHHRRRWRRSWRSVRLSSRRTNRPRCGLLNL